MHPNRRFPRLLLPEGLALEFFGTFARFEYALKASGFAKGNSNRVDPDWDSFAAMVSESFESTKDEAFLSAVTYLLNEPPRKQILQDGRVRWKESPPNPGDAKSQQTLLMIRRVRNNLFHGAKMWSPEYDDGDRDTKLVKASMVVLGRCIYLNHKLTQAYEEGAF